MPLQRGKYAQFFRVRILDEQMLENRSIESSSLSSIGKYLSCSSFISPFSLSSPSLRMLLPCYFSVVLFGYENLKLHTRFGVTYPFRPIRPICSSFFGTKANNCSTKPCVGINQVILWFFIPRKMNLIKKCVSMS